MAARISALRNALASRAFVLTVSISIVIESRRAGKLKHTPVVFLLVIDSRTAAELRKTTADFPDRGPPTFFTVSVNPIVIAPSNAGKLQESARVHGSRERRGMGQ
jgi:hypothetical protein